MADFLRDCFTAILDGLKTLLGFIAKFFEGIFELFKKIAEIIFDAHVWFFRKFYEWLISSLSSPINEVFSSLDLPYEFSWSSELYSTINFFVPLNEALAICSAVFIFWFGLFVLKIILKLIPSVY